MFSDIFLENPTRRKGKLTLNTGKIGRTVVKLYKDFKQDNETQEKVELSSFQIQIACGRLGRKNLQSSILAEVRTQGKNSSPWVLFPLKKSLNFQIAKAQGYKGLTMCRCNKMQFLQKT